MFETFEAAEEKYYALWYCDEPNYQEALKIAKWSYDTYPEHAHQIMLDLSILYAKTGQHLEAIETLNHALDQEIWYPKVFLEEFWNEKWFAPIAKRWTHVSQKAIEKSRVRFEWLSPEGVAKDKPLFIALHGWGEDIPLFKQFWKSSSLNDDFNTLFIQSSQMVGARHYKWSDYQIAKEDIKKVLLEIEASTNINTQSIYVGGFSEGATTSIKLAFEDNDFDVKAFIALNPSLVEEVSPERIWDLNKKGVSGGIITGDQDACYQEQIRMKEILEAEKFQLAWYVTKDFGHWFPKDLSQKIDKVINTFNL